jgi:hypothetical protein
LQVPFNGVHADHPDRGDLEVRTTGGQELEDLGLAAGQAVCPRRGMSARARRESRCMLSYQALGFRQQPGDDASQGPGTC